MKKKMLLITLFVSLSISFWGCQSEQFPVENESAVAKSVLNKSMINSAKLYLYVGVGGDHDVRIHMLKEDWDINEVSWYERTVDKQWSTTSGGGTFDEDNYISFIPNVGFQWIEVDVFDLVKKWEFGEPNYGIILEQDTQNPLVSFMSENNSSNTGYGPYIKIDYSDNSEPMTIYTHNDCAIWNTEEDTRADGDWLNVGVGNIVKLDHRVLIKFDLPEDFTNEGENCTHTKAYWKTHAKGKKKDPVWDLLEPDGKDTKFFKSKKSYYKILWTPPRKGNVYYILAYEYIAAELNKLSGADFSEISDDFYKATELFETYTPKKIERLKKNNELRKQILELTKELREYNTGEVGPGHCDDYKWREDDKEWKKWFKDKWGKWKKHKDDDDGDKDDDDDNP